MNTYNFIEKAQSVHGTKYDYSRVEYTNTETKVCIICPEHGEFWQSPHNHLKGRGCPECKKVTVSNARKASRKTPIPIKDERTKTEKFIEKARKIHGDKYDYSKVDYVNSDEKVCIICPEHGEFWQTPHNHLSKKGCPLCGNERKRELKIQANATQFITKSQGVHHGFYDYSKVNYMDNHTKVIITCPVHGDFLQRPYSHASGEGCPKCGLVERVGKRTMTKEGFVKQARLVHGDKYEYVGDYVNSATPMKMVCPIHGEFEQTPHNHLQGKGCPECGNKKISEKLRYTSEDFIKKAQEIHGDKYDYSKVKYTNNHTVVDIICPKHGVFQQSPMNHLKMCGCPSCGNDLISLKLRLSTEEFVKKARKIHKDIYDYSDIIYVNYDTPVKIRCKKHGIFSQTPDAHLQGKGCPKCQHQQSKPELEIIEFLKQYLKPEQIIERNREILDGREIDILLPDFRIGIEFNGLHWHSHKFKQDRYYHKNKMDLANSKGFRLIQIFEDEWISHKDIVLNKLRHFVRADMNERCIGARKCDIKTINHLEAKEFLSAYHIQGYVPSTVYLGAYYNEELVGVMSFTEEQPKMWNLMRFTTKTDYRLPGLANKLFKYFLKNYEYVEVKSFLDLRWNQSLDGNTVYDKLGFVLDSYVAPDYRYIVGSERKHKFGFRKNILHKKYGLPLTMTEKEMCDKLGFERIYDCGLAKFVYKDNPQSA